MHRMTPEYMGGFVTSAGPECICSWAVPIPVISKTILVEIARNDSDIVLPVNDVVSRMAIGEADYGDVWTDVDLKVEFEPERCTVCRSCLAAEACPMRAISNEAGRVRRDEDLCFYCGMCVNACPSGVFCGRLGVVRLRTAAESVRSIPVVLRQSDRLRAVKLAEELKRRILDGTFRMSEPVGPVG